MTAARLAWGGLLALVGALSILPITMTASGLARWDDLGPEAAHHADSIVLDRVSPWPVDSDEQLVAVGFGLLITAGLAIAAVAVHRRLRRRIGLSSAVGALLAVAVWFAPSVFFWLVWPSA